MKVMLSKVTSWLTGRLRFDEIRFTGLSYATQVAADPNNRRIRSDIATWTLGYSGWPGNNPRDKKSKKLWFVQTYDLVQMCVEGANQKLRNGTFIQSLIQEQKQM